MSFTTIEQFKALLANPDVAHEALIEKEASMRSGPPSDHQAAHDTWQIIFAADALLTAKLSEGLTDTDALELTTPAPQAPVAPKPTTKKKSG